MSSISIKSYMPKKHFFLIFKIIIWVAKDVEKWNIWEEE